MSFGNVLGAAVTVSVAGKVVKSTKKLNRRKKKKKRRSR